MVKSLAYQVLTDPEFHGVMGTLGIRPEDWPEGPVRALVLQYGRDRETNGHEYAVWNATRAKSWDDVQRLEYVLPETDAGIRAAYREALDEYRVHGLAQDLQRTPGRAAELIARFEAQRTAQEVGFVDMAASLAEYHARYTERVMQGEAVRSLPHWPELSGAIGGFNPARIAICKAQSGFGKSTLAFNLAWCMALKYPVVYVNMEMALDDMFERYYGMITGATFNSMRRDGPPGLEEIDGVTRVGRLFMTDGRDMDIRTARSFARRIARECRARGEQLGGLFIDYDQKLALEVPSGSSEWREIQRATGVLEETSKELGCFGMMLAQSNLEGQISSSHRARFSASNVWDFRRDEVHGDIIAFDKNRFAPRGTAIRVNYEGACGRVTEIDRITLEQGTGEKKGRLR